jgi:hypothetical protein
MLEESRQEMIRALAVGLQDLQVADTICRISEMQALTRRLTKHNPITLTKQLNSFLNSFSNDHILQEVTTVFFRQESIDAALLGACIDSGWSALGVSFILQLERERAAHAGRRPLSRPPTQARNG